MAIGNCLSTIRNAAASAASTVYDFGKDLVGKGAALCSSLAEKVSQVAGRCIPNVVSKAVTEHGKIASFIAGVGVAGIAAAVGYRILSNSNKQAERASLEQLGNVLQESHDDGMQLLRKQLSALSASRNLPYHNIP